MLGNLSKIWFILLLLITAFCAPAWAGPSITDMDSPNATDPVDAYQGVSKVRPNQSPIFKVDPYGGISSALGSVSRFNPMNWGLDCYLPTPARKQFVVGFRSFFARVQGTAEYGPLRTGIDATEVDFNDHLGIDKSGNFMWSIHAHYQLHPRWGLRYSFMPLSLDGKGSPPTSFTFAGRTYTMGTPIRSKWEHFEHTLGVVYNVTRATNSETSVFAEWMMVQDKLTVGEALGATTPAVWNDDKNVARIGVEFNKCLRNYKGNTLSITCKGAIAFLDDAVGYDAEAALSYLVPIKKGRFGFVKGGYRYAQLKKDETNRTFSSTLDGAFVELGFLF